MLSPLGIFNDDHVFTNRCKEFEKVHIAVRPVFHFVFLSNIAQPLFS